MGLIAALASAVLASAKDLVSKRLAFRLDGTASTFASFAYALPFYALILTVMYLMGEETFALSGAFLLLVLLRSITDTLAEWLKMSAFTHGDISLVVSFFSLSPVIMLFTSPLITGDVPSFWGSAAVVIVTIGSLLLVYRPISRSRIRENSALEDDENRILTPSTASRLVDSTTASFAAQKKAILLAICAALFFSLNSCFDRLAVQKAHPVLSGFAMTLLSALFLLPLIVGNAARLAGLGSNWRGLWIRGFLEATFMVCKLTALQYWQAPYVAGFQRFSLVLSIIGGRVFFKEADFGRRLAAGILILGGILLIACLEEN
ncbi:MAG TPA: EamA family transporter [Gemmataceae bacterium]|nr:EamA family transporter [Gemmataceae bacterium]